ncbi:hypothetical protein LXL04_000485 [Taraxacum kok-saghyz]
MSAPRRPRVDIRGCSVFVFWKCEDLKTSARGLLGTDLDRSLLTSSKPNLIHRPLKEISPLLHRDSTAASPSSAPLSDRLQHRSSSASTGAPLLHTNRRFQAISADFSRELQPQTVDFKQFQATTVDFSRELQPISVNFCRFHSDITRFHLISSLQTQGHPKAATLKTTPLVFPELCATLFDGNSATGNMRWTSSQTTSAAGSSSCPVVPLQLTGTSFHALDDDDDGISLHSDGPFPNAPSPTANRPQKRAKPTTLRGHSATPSTPCSSSPIDNLSLKIEQALEHLMKVPIKPKIPTIPEYVEKLEVLQLEPDDPLRLAAFHVFGGVTSAREMFTMNHDQIILFVILMYLYVRFIMKRGVKRMRDNDSAITGHQYTLELLERNPQQYNEVLRISRDSFVRLCCHFRVHYSLQDNKHVSVEEKMAMFFMMIGHNQRYVMPRMLTFEDLWPRIVMKEGLSDEYFARYEEPNVTCPNNNEPVDDAEVEVPTQGSAADRDYMITLRDEIAERLLAADCRRLDHLFFCRALQMWSADCRCFGSEKTNRISLKPANKYVDTKINILT